MAEKFAFMVTSAINTKFGMFESDVRLTQTKETIDSIKKHVPDAKIILLEMSAIPLTDDQKNTLISMVDNFLDFTSDPAVIDLFHSTDNWDVVKNVTEVMCFMQALDKLKNSDAFVGIDRVFKLSGRYHLNENFNIEYYKNYSVKSHIVVKKSYESQFSFNLTKVKRQFMSRLWSWPIGLLDEVIDVYRQGLIYMQERILDSGYVDIEHVLYKFLDHQKIIEKDSIGVQGFLGPNGKRVRD